MIIKLIPQRYRVGDEIYLLFGNSYVLVTVTDAYKYSGRWFYSIDVSNYTEGFELEWIYEEALSKTPSGTKRNKPLPAGVFFKLVAQFEGE